MSMDEEDDLYAIRTAFYVGDFKGVVKEAKNLKHLKGLKAKERDAFIARSFIAQKDYKRAQQVIGDNEDWPPLFISKQLLIYSQGTSSTEREMVVDNIKQFLKKDESVSANTTFCVVAAQIFIGETLYKEALQLVNRDESLELLLMQVQIYLRINRPDLAAKCVSKMQEKDDDDALTSLAVVACNLFVGGEQKTKEAADLLSDLCANVETAQLRTMEVVALMQLHQFSQAWKVLQKARDLCKNTGQEISSAILVNGIVCLQHLNKGTQNIPRLTEDLLKKESDPEAPTNTFLKRNKDMEVFFDRCAENFKL